MPTPPAPAAVPAEISDWCEVTLTRRCNQRCFFCYEDARDIARDPDLATVRRLLRDTRARAEQVVLCGKEVLLRPDILEIVSSAVEIGLRVVVFTNGQALAREGLVAALADAGCASLTVSFHFPDAETFARGTRTSARGFERTLRGLAEVSRHNRARPERAIPTSTETAMSALNLGRLAAMRGALVGALGASGWKMRIASLLPTRTHDIGLEHVLEPMAERRAELADLVATHPPELPLHFVKVPLCVVPPGHEHRSLEVEYLHAGTALSFNHGDRERITVDTITPSAGRDVAAAMAEHPYRFVCRRCALAPLCRFERVDWHHQRFEPTRAQKPAPPQGVTAAEVLARLGPRPAAAARAGALAGALDGEFPEEEVLAALERDGGIRVLDVWVEREPILALEVERDGARAALRIAAPARAAHALRPLGGVVDYLEVRAVPGHPPPPQAARALLEALARARLPEIDRWAAAPWFDPAAATALRSAWRTLGERMWPGLGGFGEWGTRTAALAPTGALRLRLAHPAGGRAEVSCEPRLGGEGSIVCTLEPRPGPAAARAHEDLVATLRAISARVETRRGPLPTWSTQPPRGAGAPAEAQGLRFTVRDRVRLAEYRFDVTIRGPRPFFRAVGALALSHVDRALAPRAEPVARVLVAAMGELGAGALRRGAEAEWAACAARLLDAEGLGAEYECAVSWVA